MYAVVLRVQIDNQENTRFLSLYMEPDINLKAEELIYTTHACICILCFGSYIYSVTQRKGHPSKVVLLFAPQSKASPRKRNIFKDHKYHGTRALDSSR